MDTHNSAMWDSFLGALEKCSHDEAKEVARYCAGILMGQQTDIAKATQNTGVALVCVALGGILRHVEKQDQRVKEAENKDSLDDFAPRFKP